MSPPDPIQTTVDQFAREAGFTKKRDAWYRRQSETLALIQSQKSQWGRQYYVNVALWLLPLGEADYPKEQQCHVRTRLSRLVNEDETATLDELLDLEAEVDDREGQLMQILRARLRPLLDASKTLEDLRRNPARTMVDASLVTGPAQRLLAKR